MKTLVIAPHPDDEINLAGQWIASLDTAENEFFLLYVTNGDYTKKKEKHRLKEARDAAKVLGIDGKHLMFLGYPDGILDDVHLYNASENTVVESRLHKTQTSGTKEIPEYCYLKNGVHHLFTRENFKADFKNAILDVMPDLIIVPEFDSHPDHRATSLTFDEVMGEILKEKADYIPIVLKKYIQEGVWHGPRDYYYDPPLPTKTAGGRTYSGGQHDLDSPAFRWEDRICLRPTARTLTPFLTKNIVFRAALKHKQEPAWFKMLQVINADVTYWRKETKNLALHAEISASSGDGSFVNDYKYYDSANINNVAEPFLDSERFCWQPNEGDAEKTIRMKFPEGVYVKVIQIYEDCNQANHIRRLIIQADGAGRLAAADGADDLDDEVLWQGSLREDGSKTKIILPKAIHVNELTFTILESTGTPGISEIEVFECEQDPLQSIPLPEYRAAANTQTPKRRQGLYRMEEMMLYLRFVPINRVLKKVAGIAKSIRKRS